MSNVLIGIIGVILFIGLALAGALFLGPRFSDSKSTSTAAATVQAVSQVASAVGLSNAETASRAVAGVDPTTFATAKYLKTVPVNPGGTASLILLSKDGEASGQDAGMVVARLDATSGGKTCGAIVRQTKNATDSIGTDGYVTVADAASIPAGPAGCFRVGATAVNGLLANEFYAFARI